MDSSRFFALLLLIIGQVDGKCSNETLTFIREQRIAASFTALKKYEASDVVLRPDGQMFYVVFDNSFKIGAFCTSGSNCEDTLLDWPDPSVEKDKSDFEGMAYNRLNGNYFVVQEAIPSPSEKKKFQPNVFEMSIPQRGTSVQLIESCLVNCFFDSDSKGFEGLEFVIHQKTGKSYLLGLCEANLCASRLDKDRESNHLGNGRLVLMEKRQATQRNRCSWEPLGLIPLPRSVTFLDYSAVSINRQTTPHSIAVTSQEDSQLWIGTIEEIDHLPFFQISSPEANLLDTPRVGGKDCEVQYCNIEGVAWSNARQVILVSDQAKTDQPTICATKEQQIHYFTFSN